MGRPVVLRCRGGDRDTEGARGSSRPGNRPTHASTTRSNNKHRTSESKWPSALPALSESRKDPYRDQTRRTNSVTVNIHTDTTDTSAHRTNTQTCGEPLPGGDHAEVAGPTLPPGLSGKSLAISGVGVGHRNRKHRKNCCVCS